MVSNDVSIEKGTNLWQLPLLGDKPVTNPLKYITIRSHYTWLKWLHIRLNFHYRAIIYPNSYLILNAWKHTFFMWLTNLKTDIDQLVPLRSLIGMYLSCLAFNPFPHVYTDTFWHFCTRRLLKKLWQKEKLLKMSIFHFIPLLYYYIIIHRDFHILENIFFFFQSPLLKICCMWESCK